MTHKTRNIAILGCCSLLFLTTACQSRDEPDPQQPGPASVTVYPIVLAGRPSADVARVVALMLERGGATQIEFGAAAFVPKAGADFDQQSRTFATFATKQPLDTDYALYGAYLGSPTRGVDEVRGVLVDAHGRVVWSDRQRPGNRDFDRLKPSNPMSCTRLLVERLRKPLHLADPFRKNAPRGKQAEQFRRESGIPDDTERAAMAARQKSLRAAAPKANVVVYPMRVGNDYSHARAEDLAKRINKNGLLAARVAKEELRFDFEPSMNEQKVLWSGARSIQSRLRAVSLDADYALIAHCVTTGAAKEPFAMHLYVLDRRGDLVVVDFQNSHHSDFRRLVPGTSDSQTKLAVARLRRYLK